MRGYLRSFAVTAVLLSGILTLTTGCGVTKYGDDLNGFCERMNAVNEAYALSEEGYFTPEETGVSGESGSTSSGSLNRYYLFQDTRLLVSFEADRKGRLTAMHLVSERACAENQAALQFMRDAAAAFLRDADTARGLLEKAEFPASLQTPTLQTTCADSGTARIQLDVTTVGVVISFYREIG